MPSVNRERAVILAITAILLWTWSAGPEHIAGAVILAGFLCWYVGKRSGSADTAAHAYALPMPPDAASDNDGREMIRVWIATNDLHVSLNLGMFANDEDGVDEREAWGQILADTIRHIANGLQQSHGLQPEASISLIREELVAHLENQDAFENTEGGYVGDDGKPEA